jgi:alcohol dehydrogenase class IV
MRRPFLVTDAALAKLPMIRDVLDLCAESQLDCGLYSEVQGNPVAANVDGGVDQYRAGGHDGVIAFGGGSGLDAAKAIALMVGQQRPLWDFEDREDWWTRADEDGIAPLVAVPTTAGTGSEVGRAAVITDERDHTKKIIFHPKMLPAIVVSDPELTVGLPPAVTAAVGMDALSHNLEAYCSPLYHPMADGIALEGMRLIKDWLSVAVREGDNIEARSQMMVAASMGATAFQKGLGAMHSLSHPCGSVLGTHHGLTNGVVMPYVLEFNRPAIEEKMKLLGRVLGLADPTHDGVLDWIIALREQIGIPHRLADLGVSADKVPEFSRMAAVDPPSATNPVAVNVANLGELYHRAIEGELQRSERA